MLNGTHAGPSRGCHVKRLEPPDANRWDSFVQASPQATFFHRSAWSRVIEQAFGHRCHYIYAEDAGQITGILPLAEIKSRLFGHALISTPFCVYGGIAATDEEVAAQLRQAACRLAQELRVEYLELRNRAPDACSWLAKDLYFTFRKPLHADHEANFKAIPRKQRAMVRKGIEAGLKAEACAGLVQFYDVYAESLRNLGTPVFARRYFTLLREAFPEDCEITVVTHDEKPVAAVMSFYFRDEVLPYYGGSTAAGREVQANDFMYWAVMQKAVERGARLFDYGRSKRDTGSYHFKKHWGFEPEPLHYQYQLVRAKTLPDVSPVNPKYRLFIKAWQHLPLSVSRVVGPWIARSLG
ncbi:MAG: FemAB family PEP-CTERM system-associated protein [Gammaproteobacteria bacterium]|nr:FemAB family PEP-CTERM system-associated protein [Gammaproteobacteria bacterium]